MLKKIRAFCAINIKNGNELFSISYGIYLIMGYICSKMVAIYSEMLSTSLATIIFFILFLFFGHFARRLSFSDTTKITLDLQRWNKMLELNALKHILIILFAVVLSLSLLFGKHIHMENGYNGLMDVNYIVSYTMFDRLAFMCLCIYIYLMILYLYTFWKYNQDKKNSGILVMYRKTTKQDYKHIIIGAVILFFSWLPYFLIYYPGFIFHDSLNSIAQSMGDQPLTNTDPVMYTLCIKCCLALGKRLGSLTMGCAIYSIMQMIYVSLALSSIIVWCGKYFKSKKITWVILLLMGGQAYFGQMSIAMWKDPVFSVTIVLLILKIADYVMSEGKVVCDERFFWLKYCFFSIVIIFVRNNGLYLLFFEAVVILIIWFRYKVKGYFMGTICLVTLGTVLVSYIITGSVYERLGWSGKTVEKYGVFLAQMERIVVYNGNMSIEDLQYMDALYQPPEDDLEITQMNDLKKRVTEKYKSAYYPCCIDNFKWSTGFQTQVLEQDFMKHYISMVIKNPKLAVEAWAMMTYGFWTVNHKEINLNASNITWGVPRNYNIPTNWQNNYNGYNIHSSNLLENDDLIKYFPYSENTVPIGILFWMLLLVILFFVLSDRILILPIVAPVVGLMATLAIAAPIWYWSRYGAALLYMIPFFLILFFGVYPTNMKLRSTERYVRCEKINASQLGSCAENVHEFIKEP